MQFRKNQRVSPAPLRIRTIGGESLAYLAAGCVTVFGIVCLMVIQHPPPEIPRAPDALAERALERHNYGVYFQAVAMAKLLLPGMPGIRWSHIGMNRQSSTCVLKHGLWYAQGLADVPVNSGAVTRQEWQLIFEPELEKPVYFRIGDLQCGDVDAAARAMSGQ